MKSFMRWRRTTVLVGSGLVALGAVGPASARQPAETVGPGYKRVHREDRVRITPERLQAMLAAGKSPQLDPATGELVRSTFTDHLPADWRLERPADGARTDSLGNPIVNDTPGLPAWAKRDVDALRAEIGKWKGQALLDRVEQRNSREAEGMLGNFIAQAIMRGIPVDDIANIDDPGLATDGVAAAILDGLHFYENIRFANQDLFHYQYTPTVYPARIAAFAARHGRDLAQVQSLEPTSTLTLRGGQPSGCYARTTFARGILSLSGATAIWTANGFDDESADIATGFPLFFFYDCQDPDNNDTVRVSTNGYISFFQQGSGALDGTNFTNDAIPNAEDPDGYTAPWWDDLIIATSQGSTDSVQYKTEGAADSRVFTVEWSSVSRLDGVATDYHYFQVKLFETSDVVELHYGLDVSAWQPDTLDNATCGIENYSGAGGDCGPNCLNTNSAPPPNDYRFTPSPRPDNDNCGNAIEVISGANIDGNLHRATPDGNANCGDSSNNRDVWYTYVARCNGTLRITSCGSRDINGPNMGIDTVISAHTGCPGTASNQLTCNDDAGAVGCSGTDSAISVPLVVGQRVFVRVTHFGDLAFRFASGAYRVFFDLIPTSPAANDNCTSAAAILDGNTLVGNLLCTSNDGAADCGSSETNDDAWYTFTSPRLGVLEISACGSRNNAGTDTGPDTAVSIHAGCPGNIANELACNDDGFIPGCNTLDSRATAPVSAGQTVKVRVSHFGDSAFRVGNGVFVVHASLLFCPADFNHSAMVTVQDIFDFLAAYFANDPRADINGSGAVSVQDIFDFLAAYFAGC
jgi:hypothetical protein